MVNSPRKYRGRELDTNKWVYGSIIHYEGRAFIFNEDSYETEFEIGHTSNMVLIDYHAVHPDTVGQYTSYTTYKGKDVYEGDGGNKPNNGTHIWGRYIVKFGRFMHDSHEYIGYYLDWLDAPVDELSVSITDHLLDFDMNIHDNPELLEQQ